MSTYADESSRLVETARGNTSRYSNTCILTTVGIFMGVSVLSAGLVIPLTSSSTGFGRVTEYPEVKLLLDHLEGGNSVAWDNLAQMVDTYGPRVTGSQGLELSLDWIEQKAQAEGLRVYTESVDVVNWVRGSESLTFTIANRENIAIPILGLGLSIGTDGAPITADLIVLTSWDQLDGPTRLDVRGKVVLMNIPFTNYGAGSNVRRTLATRASAEGVGAVAALVRSVTPFSLRTPHTGSSDTATIPTAAVTTEDANMFQRIQERNETISVTLTMGATGCSAASLACATVASRNVIIEIPGKELPQEIVVIGGHIDSWDVGQGAVDDASGAFVAWGALSALRDLGIAPKRTIRAVFWNGEENTGAGADAYYAAHANLENETHILAVECDGGTWSPYGFTISETSVPEDKFGKLQAYGRQLERIGASDVSYGGAGADVGIWCQLNGTQQPGVPCGSLIVRDPITGVKPEGEPESSGYFWFHHTEADTMDALPRDQFDQSTAAFAVFAWTVAEFGI